MKRRKYQVPKITQLDFENMRKYWRSIGQANTNRLFPAYKRDIDPYNTNAFLQMVTDKLDRLGYLDRLSPHVYRYNEEMHDKERNTFDRVAEAVKACGEVDDYSYRYYLARFHPDQIEWSGFERLGQLVQDGMRPTQLDKPGAVGQGGSNGTDGE